MENMAYPTVSVVMATYNRQEILEESVYSVLNQSFGDFELIIVDDCSTDNTRSILHNLQQQDRRIKILNTPKNSGCNIARNLAIDLACGKYIAIMDDDDIADPDRLMRQVEYLEQHPDIGLVGSAVRLFFENGLLSSLFPPKYIIDKIPDSPDRLFEDVYLGKYIIPNPTLMFRSPILKHNKYPAVHYNGADVTLILQLAVLGVKMRVIPDPLVMTRRGITHKQMTFSLENLHLGRRRRIRDFRKWLAIRGIEKSDHLHRKALLHVTVKHLIEFAFSRGKFKGLPVYLRALRLSPIFTLSKTRDHIFQRLARGRCGRLRKSWRMQH